MTEDYGTLRVGYVYLLTNSAIPDIVKIGMTTRLPSERAKELSNTGVPGRWTVHYSIFVPDCAVVERIVHGDLKHRRFSDDREFFRITLADAQAVIKSRADENMAACPGWPDPQSVKSFADKQKLQALQEAENKRQQREREQAAGEKQRAEYEKQALEERRKSVDASTRKILASGPIGWVALIVAGYWVVAIGNKDFGVVAALVSGAFGFWIRTIDKRGARELRIKWNLPPV